MTHRLNIDEIHENIFLVLNMCYAAEKFAKKHDLTTYDEADLVNGPYYVGWLRNQLSEKLVEISIKMRILLDLIAKEEARYKKEGSSYLVDTKAIDGRIVGDFNIGYLTPTKTPLTIREAANKIIHALEVILITEFGDGEHELDEESPTKREWTYWNGTLELRGAKWTDEWSLTLNVPEFCRAVHEFISEVECNVDWSSIHYDIDCF